jgi:hypothetical protein
LKTKQQVKGDAACKSFVPGRAPVNSEPDVLRNRFQPTPYGVDEIPHFGEFDPGSGRTLAACLIHASRTGLHGGSLRVEAVQPSGGRVSNAWATCPPARDNFRKRELIPDAEQRTHVFCSKASALEDGPASH